MVELIYESSVWESALLIFDRLERITPRPNYIRVD